MGALPHYSREYRNGTKRKDKTKVMARPRATKYYCKSGILNLLPCCVRGACMTPARYTPDLPDGVVPIDATYMP